MKYIRVSQEFLHTVMADQRVQELRQLVANNSTDCQGFHYQGDSVLIPLDHVQATWIILIHPHLEFVELGDPA